MAISGSPSATFGGRARARRPHPCSRVPARHAVGQRRLAADGPAARRPVLIEFFDVCRARSLRTLPYMQAWHERYARTGCGSCRSTRPATRRRSTRTSCARPSSASASSTPSGSTTTSTSGTTSATRAGPPATCSPASPGCSSTTTAWAASTRPSWRSRSCSGSSATSSRRCGRRTSRAPTSSCPRPTRRAHRQAPTRRAPCGPSSRARDLTVNGETREIGWTGVHALLEHPVHTEGVLELEPGPGVVCHAVQFDAR